MKVLQVNSVYKKGSTGKIVWDIHQELMKNGIESVVCYGRGEVINEPNVYKTCGELYSKANNLWSRITGVMYGGCFFSTNKLIAIIKKEKPDIVHLHCINGYFANIYRIITWLKQQNIRTVLTLHAEFMYTANCGHALECDRWKTGCGHCPRLRQETKTFFVDNTALSWNRMKKAFDGFHDNLIVAAVSPWLCERAKQSVILSDKKHTVVLNGLDTDIFKPCDAADLKKKHGLSDERIVFHVTPAFNNDPNHIKGGYYVLQLAEMMKNERVKFFVAGRHAPGLSVPENLVLLGQIYNPQELAKYYSMADVTVITSKKETFSMVCAESLSCGTPIVGFTAGAPEMISLSEHSVFVGYGKIKDLYNAILFLELDGQNTKTSIASRADICYSKAVMCAEYIQKYESLLGD